MNIGLKLCITVKTYIGILMPITAINTKFNIPKGCNPSNHHSHKPTTVHSPFYSKGNNIYY